MREKVKALLRGIASVLGGKGVEHEHWFGSPSYHVLPTASDGHTSILVIACTRYLELKDPDAMRAARGRCKVLAVTKGNLELCSPQVRHEFLAELRSLGYEPVLALP